LRDEGYTPEQIAEHFAKRAAAPTYEDVLDEVPDDQVGPPRKFRPPLKVFFYYKWMELII
jgi:hypothetical protein